MVLGLLVSGDVGSSGWIKKDGQPVDQIQFSKDRKECNKGMVQMLTTLSFGSALVHSSEPVHCMTAKGYIKEVK
jgi:hypothetical protein